MLPAVAVQRGGHGAGRSGERPGWSEGKGIVDGEPEGFRVGDGKWGSGIRERREA